jgi:hypothetical protein
MEVSTTADGRHLQVTLKEAAGDPTNIANYGIVYTKDDGAGVTELFFIDSAGTVTQLTNGGHAATPILFPVEASDPANAANKGWLYGKDANSKIELFWEDEDGNVLQLTSAGVANVTKQNNDWTAGQAVTPVQVTDAATLAVDAALSDNFYVTLGGNRTLDPPSNPKEGQVLSIRFIQDGTGSRTLTLNASFKKGASVSTTLSTTAAAEDLMVMQYLNSIWRIVSLTLGITTSV